GVPDTSPCAPGGAAPPLPCAAEGAFPLRVAIPWILRPAPKTTKRAATMIHTFFQRGAGAFCASCVAGASCGFAGSFLGSSWVAKGGGPSALPPSVLIGPLPVRTPPREEGGPRRPRERPEARGDQLDLAAEPRMDPPPERGLRRGEDQLPRSGDPP